MTIKKLLIGFINLLRYCRFPQPIHMLRVSLSTHIQRKSGEMKIGKKFSTRRNVEINVREQACLVIGDHVFINSGSIITCRNHIHIGDNTILGPGVMIFDHDHAIINGKPMHNRFESDTIHIGKNVWIGAGSIILKGSNIKDGSIVAAGSLVNKEIPEGNIFIQRRKSELMPIHCNENKN